MSTPTWSCSKLTATKGETCDDMKYMHESQSIDQDFIFAQKLQQQFDHEMTDHDINIQPNEIHKPNHKTLAKKPKDPHAPKRPLSGYMIY